MLLFFCFVGVDVQYVFPSQNEFSQIIILGTNSIPADAHFHLNWSSKFRKEFYKTTTTDLGR